MADHLSYSAAIQEIVRVGGIWLIPTNGGAPREVARFDDPLRPVYRDDFSSEGESVYFVVTELASSLWTASLVEGR
jgi:hypothetical protein